MSTKIGVDVTHCNGSMVLQTTNTYISPSAAFDNVVGIYFEDADGLALSEALIMYPQTKNQDLSEFYAEVPVPLDAVWLGYWLLPNGAGAWMKYPDFNQLDRLELRQDDDGFMRMYHTREVRSRFYPDELHVFRPGQRCLTNGFAGQVHLSNPDHNYGGAQWFFAQDDGSVLIEDWKIGSNLDFGIWWSRPRKPRNCNC